MTQVIINEKYNMDNGMPENKWFLARHKETNEVKMVIRPYTIFHSWDESVVYYVGDNGLSWDRYVVFEKKYDLIGSVNTIEVC